MNYTWNWQIILASRGVFVDGMLWTIELTVAVVGFGLLLGVLLALCKQSPIIWLRWAVSVYIELFRGLPVLVLLVWLYYVLPFAGVRISPWTAAWVGLSVNLSAFAAETIRAGMQSIPPQQVEAARVFAMSRLQIYRHVIFPQTVYRSLPNLLNLSITQLKMTSLASIIGVNELLHQSNLLISHTFRPLEVYTAVGVCYLLLVIPATLVSGWCEQWIQRYYKHL